jgi:hypothetical protein
MTVVFLRARVGSTPRRRLLSAPVSAALPLLVALGCASEIPEDVPDAESSSRHALVSVERSVLVNPDEPAQAEALAQFPRVPARDEPASVLRAAGLIRDLPGAGECMTPAELAELSGALSATSSVEFLDVGEVTIQAGEAVTALGAHAFPTVSDFASGVVYATRDRDPEPLPPGETYLITVAGSPGVDGMTFHASAPLPLDNVTLGGLPLAEVEAVPASQPLDLTWTVGQPGDLVYVALTTQDESSGVVCSFRDEDGVGTIPGDFLPATSLARLSLHRMRRQALRDAPIDSGEIRFDFELATALELE